MRGGAGLVLVAVFVGFAFSTQASGKAAPTPGPGNYSGSVGAYSISFKVSSNKKTITGLSSIFDPAPSCGIPPGTSKLEHERFPPMQIHNGHFSGSTSTGTSLVTHYAVQGKFISSTKVTGKISGHLTVPSLPPCHASGLFSAKRKGK